MKLGWISSLSWLASREDIAKEWFDGAGYTYAGYPVGSGGSAYLVLTSLGVSASCQNLAGAKAFLAYCFSGKQESGLPANMEVLREELAQYKARKPHRLVRRAGRRSARRTKRNFWSF